MLLDIVFVHCVPSERLFEVHEETVLNRGIVCAVKAVFFVAQLVGRLVIRMTLTGCFIVLENTMFRLVEILLIRALVVLDVFVVFFLDDASLSRLA